MEPVFDSRIRVISDISYGKSLGAADPTVRLGQRTSRLLTTLAMAARSHGASVIFTNQGARSRLGIIVLCAYLAATRQRKLVLSEFLPPSPAGRSGKVIESAYSHLLKRAVASVQVMTSWEKEAVIARYGIHAERVVHMPFYFYDDRISAEPMPFDETKSGIVSTGKNSCDWTTLFAASEPSWKMTAVMTEGDYLRVKDEADASGAVVRVNIPRDEHDDLLRSSELFLLVLKENAVSAGHVRLMTCATMGTPVVATAVDGVRGYEQLAIAVVPQGDPDALRSAVREALGDRGQLARRMSGVTAVALSRPRSTYLQEIADNVASAATSVG